MGSKVAPELRLFDLSGRVALITGGGTHIGKAIARVLAAHGAQVHIVGRRLGVVHDAATELGGDGLECVPHQCDAADAVAFGRLVDSIVADAGRLDIAIANAGGAEMGPPAPAITLSRWEATLRISATTALITAQTAAKAMLERKSGRVILMSSIYGVVGPDLRNYGSGFTRVSADYMAAKSAVVGLTRGLAVEFGKHGINVNCISPGQIPYASSDPETVEKFRLANPLGLTGVPTDLQGAALLLSSDAARFITGHNLVVDGGWTTW